MEGSVRRIDEEVVHVDDETSFSDHIAEGVIQNHWKVAGELVSLKNMTVGSNSPLWVTKAAFH